ncbi:unnamed protein product [Cladocopium goreaui]|uniref:Uncharacterized protein n=1 Tax=Cladocopium goreaui TaxID=2562237 RepID=A0A9P1BP42_9DINO|nr:unnamed protein product [Cladocopium goreaui]
MSCDVYANPSAQRAIHNWHFSSRFWLHCLGEGSDCIQRVLLLSVSEHHLPRHNPLQRIVLGASAERGYSTGAASRRPAERTWDFSCSIPCIKTGIWILW